MKGVRAVQRIPTMTLPLTDVASISMTCAIAGSVLFHPKGPTLSSIVLAAHYAFVLQSVVGTLDQHTSSKAPTSDTAHVDWFCASCRTLNYQRNYQCWQCGKHFEATRCQLVYVPTKNSSGHLGLDHSQGIVKVSLLPKEDKTTVVGVSKQERKEKKKL